MVATKRKRSAKELNDSKLRARRAQRVRLGWPPERLDDPPRAYRHDGRDRSADPHADVLIPVLDRCELVDEAIGKLRSHERAELDGGGRAFGTGGVRHFPIDAIGRDLVGEYVLAKLAGEDPDEALRVTRARHGRDRKWLVYGLDLTSDLIR